MSALKPLGFVLAAAALICATTGEAAARPERMCPMIYRPVCALTHGAHHRTFANRCEAENANAIVQHEGVCRRPRH